MILEIIVVKTIGITIDPTIDIITVKKRNTTQILAHIGSFLGGGGEGLLTMIK